MGGVVVAMSVLVVDLGVALLIPVAGVGLRGDVGVVMSVEVDLRVAVVRLVVVGGLPVLLGHDIGRVLNHIHGLVLVVGALVFIVVTRSRVVAALVVTGKMAVGGGKMRVEGLIGSMVGIGRHVVVTVLVVLNALVMNGDFVVASSIVGVTMMGGLTIVCMANGVDDLGNLVDGRLVVSELLLMDGAVVLALVVTVHMSVVVVFALVDGVVVRGLFVVSHVRTVVLSLAPVVLSGGNSNDSSKSERFHFGKRGFVNLLKSLLL